MVPTLVNVAFGVLIGCALLGAAFDRRSLAIVAVAAAVPSADAVAGLLLEGGTNTVLHMVWIPLAAAGAIYYDTSVRKRSWLRERYGWWGVRVSWVAVTSYAVAGIGADLFGGAGVNLLFPLYDQFLVVDGRFTVTVVQAEGELVSFLGYGASTPSIEQLGARGEYAVDSWIAPTGEERRLRLVETGWQVVVVSAAVTVGAIRAWRDL